ncbi:MAG: SPOR domain-containing protein [Litorimonas sp.]
MSDTPHEFSPDLNVAQDALQPFDVRQREGLNPMIKLALVAAGLLLAAFIVMKLYTPGVRDRSDPPRITADNTPFKVKPAEAGGAQTPNQDKVVFEVMDGNSPDTNATPDAAPEEPIKIEAPEPVVEQPVREPIAPRTEPAPTTRPAVTTPSRPTASAPASVKSDWVVQVASTRSEADAKAVWTTLKNKFPGLVSGTYADVKRADLGDKGIYYRTRVAGLADKSAAQSLCSSFKAAGQACFVAKR